MALVHDVVVTAGVYSLVGFEVTPATVIGLLTILGFSLYDTVVVFDKVKENTRGLLGLTRRTYAEAANLALNQTLMRSINTSLIAVLPVVGLLVVGVGVLGVGTLADLALVQLVGILAGRAVVAAAGHAAAGRPQDARPRASRSRPRGCWPGGSAPSRRPRRPPSRAAEEGAEPDLSDDAELARQLRRERAVAAAASTPSRAGKPAHAAGRARPTGKASRPTGKRHR